MPTRIDPTIHLLQDLLADKAAKKGAELIGKWEGDIEKAEITGAKTIHADLIKLQKHLEGDNLDGAAIGDLLTKLGESTERAAKHAEGANAAKIESLGQALVKAAGSLHG